MNWHPCGFDVATRSRPHRGGDGPRTPRTMGRTTNRRGGRACELCRMTENELLKGSSVAEPCAIATCALANGDDYSRELFVKSGQEEIAKSRTEQWFRKPIDTRWLRTNLRIQPRKKFLEVSTCRPLRVMVGGATYPLVRLCDL